MRSWLSRQLRKDHELTPSFLLALMAISKWLMAACAHQDMESSNSRKHRSESTVEHRGRTSALQRGGLWGCRANKSARHDRCASDILDVPDGFQVRCSTTTVAAQGRRRGHLHTLRGTLLRLRAECSTLSTAPEEEQHWYSEAIQKWTRQPTLQKHSWPRKRENIYHPNNQTRGSQEDSHFFHVQWPHCPWKRDAPWFQQRYSLPPPIFTDDQKLATQKLLPDLNRLERRRIPHNRQHLEKGLHCSAPLSNPDTATVECVRCGKRVSDVRSRSGRLKSSAELENGEVLQGEWSRYLALPRSSVGGVIKGNRIVVRQNMKLSEHNRLACTANSQRRMFFLVTLLFQGKT